VQIWLHGVQEAHPTDDVCASRHYSAKRSEKAESLSEEEVAHGLKKFVSSSGPLVRLIEEKEETLTQRIRCAT
jgi:hypothetical protein